MSDLTIKQKQEILRLKRLPYLESECDVCGSKINGKYFWEYGDDGDSGLLCNSCAAYEPTKEDLKDEIIELYAKK